MFNKCLTSGAQLAFIVRNTLDIVKNSRYLSGTGRIKFNIMKKLVFTSMLFVCCLLTTQLTAQSASADNQQCSKAEIEACKKICSPEQLAKCASVKAVSETSAMSSAECSAICPPICKLLCPVLCGNDVKATSVSSTVAKCGASSHASDVSSEVISSQCRETKLVNATASKQSIKPAVIRIN